MSYHATIILPTYGSRPEYLDAAIRSLQRQSYPKDLYEIVIVDNGPFEATKRIAEMCDREGPHKVLCMKEKEPGAAKARHAGVRRSKAPILVFVDDDILAPENWLENLLGPFKDPSVACVGGKVELQFETAPPDWWEKQFDRGYLSLLDHGPVTKELKWPDFVWSCNMAVRSDMLHQVGGFNPDFSGDPKELWRTGDNECGLEQKIYEAGGKIVYEPTAWIWHRIPASRLTPKYFYDRHFIEGVMESFTHVRSQKGKALVPLRLGGYAALCLAHAARKRAGSILKRSYAMKMKAESLKWWAMANHHLRAAGDPELRRYIWKESYL